MAFSEFKMDLFSALKESCDFTYEINILQGTLDELEKIAEEQRGKFKQAAVLALKIIKTKKIKILKKRGNVDDTLAELSKKGYIVLTQDAALKRRLKRPYMTIRQKKKIFLVN